LSKIKVIKEENEVCDFYNAVLENLSARKYEGYSAFLKDFQIFEKKI